MEGLVNPKWKTVSLAAALCLLAWPIRAANDGILIVEKTTTGNSTQTNQIQIEKTRMRVETMAGGQKQVVVFDGVAQVLRIIKVDAKTYTEMTKADVDRMGGQRQSAMAKMQEEMKNVPPEQRAQIEAMMSSRGMAAAVPKTEYRKTGTDHVGKWACDAYDGYLNGQKTSEVCTVDPHALGFTAADFDITQQLVAFFQQMMPQGAGQMFAIGQAGQHGFTGIPVRRMFTVGQQQTTTVLTDVTHQTFADSTYAVPAGFEKQAGPGGRSERER